MTAPVRLLLVGIGGYGRTYVDALLDAAERNTFALVGAVDPFPESCPRLEELRAAGTGLYASVEEFYEDSCADLAVISSPIHFHARQTMYCLRQGSHVLCEKPVSATLQEARAMGAAAGEAGRMLAIGYQWSFSQAVQELKEDIGSGMLGRPRRFRTLVLWPRDDAYYSRPWAGKLKDPDGYWILDSVANNATAHYLHNMLYVLGDKPERSAEPKWLEAELYRAHDIACYDTAAFRIMTTGGCELYFFATHASEESRNPSFMYEFDGAQVSYGQLSDQASFQHHIRAQWDDGSSKDYGDPNADKTRHLWMMIDAVRSGSKLEICGVDAASAHTLCINGSLEAVGTVPGFPQQYICYDSQARRTYAPGLGRDLTQCWQWGCLPSEAGFPWAQKKVKQDLRGYTAFAPKLGSC